MKKHRQTLCHFNQRETMKNLVYHLNAIGTDNLKKISQKEKRNLAASFNKSEKEVDAAITAFLEDPKKQWDDIHKEVPEGGQS